MMPGLQPSNLSNFQFPRAVTKAGMVHTFGTGEGENREWTRMNANGERGWRAWF